MAEQDRKLEGFLLKQGEGTLGRAFKKRWFSQKGTCLYYYRNKSDTNTAGFINLAEAISCHPTEGVKGKFLFQINTPRRIWHLEAETEAAMQYWVDGIKAIFNKLREEEERGRQFDRRSVRLETMENRVRDLEARDQLLKQALELACQRLGVSADQVFSQVDKGSADSLKELLIASAATSTSTSTSTSSQPAETTTSTTEHQSETSPAATETSSDVASATSSTTTTESAAPAAAAEESASTPAASTESSDSSSESSVAAAAATTTAESATPAEAPSTESSESTESATPVEAPSTESTASTTATEPAASSDAESKPAESSDDSKKAGDPAQPDKRFKAKVLYDYSAQQDYEMTIHTNEIITVLSKHGNGWWLGASAEGKQGYFPGSYVEPIAE